MAMTCVAPTTPLQWRPSRAVMQQAQKALGVDGATLHIDQPCSEASDPWDLPWSSSEVLYCAHPTHSEEAYSQLFAKVLKDQTPRMMVVIPSCLPAVERAAALLQCRQPHTISHAPGEQPGAGAASPPTWSETRAFLITGVHPCPPRIDLPLDSRTHLEAHLADVDAKMAPSIPRNFAEARRSPQAAEWMKAMEAEVEALQEHGVYEPVPRPPADVHVLPNMWVYTAKFDALGQFQKFKARLVAQGQHQVQGRDFEDSYAPVATLTAVRVLLAVAAKQRLHLRQVDVSNAYLHGRLDQVAYMHQIAGFPAGPRGTVLRLKRSLYGLKQAGRCWATDLAATMDGAGLRLAGANLYHRQGADGELTLVAVYVDDLLIASSTLAGTERVVSALTAAYRIKDLGQPSSFLGWGVRRDASSGDIHISQPAYTRALLATCNMQNAVSRPTPAVKPPSSTKPSPDASPAPGSLGADDGRTHPLQRATAFRALVGSLLWLSCSSRPDIAQAVQALCRHQVTPSYGAWADAAQVLHYLRGTEDLGITMRGPSSPPKHPGLVGYSDSSWGGESKSKALAGYLFQLHGSPISWQSKLQATVAASTTEAEYMALSHATKELLHLRRLLISLGLPHQGPVKLLGDNTSSLFLARKDHDTARSKHIDIAHHAIRDEIARGTVDVQHVPTGDQLADVFTKPLDRIKFEHARTTIGVHSPKGGC